MTFDGDRRAVRYLLGGLGAAAILATAAPAAAQSAPYLDYSDLYGAGGTITITRLPIKEPSGTVVFKDATITVTADANGTLKAKVTKQASSVVLVTSNVQAGVYARSDSGSSKFRISGPGALGGGEAEWTIVTVEGTPCGSPAEFYTGPLSQNPLYSRLQAAGITDTSYSYGIINNGSPCTGWGSNYLIGVAPIGSQVQVALFTDPATGSDQPTPYARYLYNYVSP
jgi:hypothetical protein